jgi:antirestriction protein
VQTYSTSRAGVLWERYKLKERMVRMMFNVYITNLGKYNEGELVGKWLSLPCDDIEEELASIGVADNTLYEEYFITDYENDVDYQVGEYESLDRLNELAEELEQIDYHGDGEILGAIIEARGCNLEEAIDIYNDGRYTSWLHCEQLKDVAYELVEAMTDLPEFALRYFDYEAYARDLGFCDYYKTSYGCIYVW